VDFRLSWFLGRVLWALGYGHMPSDRGDALHSSFADQLEALGLWHWSVFILLHLSCPHAREAKICDVLGRHVRPGGDSEAAEREEFLRERLKVPSKWLAAAKAVRARACRDSRDEAFYLMRAGQFAEAHEAAVGGFAPDAFINADHGFLHTLLIELAEHAEAIPEWRVNGAILLDFLDVEMNVSQLLEANKASLEGDEEDLSYQIELLRPKVTSLCGRVSSLRSGTARERLCRSEIAKKTAHLMRAMLSLESGREGVGAGSRPGAARALAQHLAALPLPDDCALQELRDLTRCYMMEIAGEAS